MSIYTTGIYASLEMQANCGHSKYHMSQEWHNCSQQCAPGSASFFAVTRTAPGWGNLRC